AIVAADEADLARKLQRAADAIARTPDDTFSWPDGVHYAHPAQAGRIALLSPGQGSQALGMGADLAMAFDEARAVWDAAASLRLDPPPRPHHDSLPPRRLRARAR